MSKYWAILGINSRQKFHIVILYQYFYFHLSILICSVYGRVYESENESYKAQISRHLEKYPKELRKIKAALRDQNLEIPRWFRQLIRKCRQSKKWRLLSEHVIIFSQCPNESTDDYFHSLTYIPIYANYFTFL